MKIGIQSLNQYIIMHPKVDKRAGQLSVPYVTND